MENKILIFIVLCALSVKASALGEYVGYQPLGTWQNPSYTAFSRWDSFKQAFSESPRAEGNRPVLPGVNDRNLELLQDVIARNYPRVTLGKLTVARKTIANFSPETVKTSAFTSARGYMAEAMFLDKNPQWGYIKSRTAKQHDVYMAKGGRGNNEFGQVKYHIGGKPSQYANDMIKDSRSQQFFVPDDHVEPLKAYLRMKGRDRDLGRVKGSNSTSAEIDKATKQAITKARIIQYSPYVSLGLMGALSFAPIVYEWSVGDISSDEALLKGAKASVPFGVTFILNKAIASHKGGLYSGSVKSNVLIASVYLIATTSLDIYSYNGLSNASQNIEFWMDTGSNLGAVALGGLGAYYGGVASSTYGPIGTILGGTVGGLIGGSVGAFGGKAIGKDIFKMVYSDAWYKKQDDLVQGTIKNIDANIKKTQKI